VLTDYLKVIGHQVQHLIDYNGFFNSVRTFKPNLILMEVQFNGSCKGFELLTQLRQESDLKNLKVVMVTDRASKSDHERGLDAGADDYLSKPINIAQLEGILMRYL
ncbi:MAG TPA: response regulator, partial [Coleofasciculaceae cyanobacterium]